MAELLEMLQPDGDWAVAGPTWSPGGAGWRILAAVQLGADPADPRLQGAAARLVAEQVGDGGFRRSQAAMPDVRLTARLAAMLCSLGWSRNPRLREAVAWLDEASPATRAGGWRGPDGGEDAVVPASLLAADAAAPGALRPALVERAAAAARQQLSDGSVSWRWTAPRLLGGDGLELTFGLLISGCSWHQGLASALAVIQRGQDDGGHWQPRRPVARLLGDLRIDREVSAACLRLEAVAVLMAWAPAAELPRLFPAKPG